MDDTKVVLCSRLNLGFNLNYFSFYIVTSVHLNFFFFALHIFNCFYQEINQTHTITLTFQVSKMDLTAFLAALVSILRVKFEKAAIRGKMCFLILWAFLLKMYIFEFVTYFSSLMDIQSTLVFSWSTYS